MSDESFDPYWQWLGIPPHDRPLNHYRLLGLPPFDSDLTRIARAADERMMQVRSYQSGPRVAYSQKLLNELAAARVCLLDPNTKATYDAVLQATLAVQAGQVAIARTFPAPAPTTAALPPSPTSPSPTPPYSTPPPPAPPPTRRTSPPPPPAHTAAPATPAPPSVSAGGAVGTAAHRRVTADGSADGAEEDRVSVFARPWFPVAAIGCIVLIAVGVWGVGRLTRRTVEINQSADASSGETGGANGGQGGADQDALTKGGKSGDGDNTGDAAGDDEPVIIAQESTGEVNFTPGTALVHGDQLRLDNVGGEEVIAGWTAAGQSLTWDFRLVRPDVFRVEITYAATDESKGARFELAVGDETKAGDVLPAASGATFRTDVLFLAVRRGGRQTLTLQVSGREGAELMALRSIRFVPKGLSSKKG